MAPAIVRRTPYKDLLQPALQRRFTTTASIILGIAFIESLILSSWSSLFWAIFPLGPTGIRAAFIFVCGLFIILLRIAQYHVGIRTSDSAFHTFTQHAFKAQTLEAIITYAFCAWLFSQVYIWTAPDDFRWITVLSGDRTKLNEKPVFFTTHFVVFGAVQGLLHIFWDDDRLLLSSVKLNSADAVEDKVASTPSRLLTEAPGLLKVAGIQSLSVLVANVIVYALFLRSWAWWSALLWFRRFYTLPKTNIVPANMPVTMWVAGRSVFAGFMLLFMWLAGNKMFSLMLVRAPVKYGNPITAESKDPNGSLLNGLKSKKLPIKCFAMWELALIARDFQLRRKVIYEDIDRKDGPMWSQVYSICLEVVKGMESRIDAYGKAPAPVSSTAVATIPEDPKGLGRVSKPPKDDPVFVSTPAKKTFRGNVEKAVGTFVNSPGNASRLSPRVQKGLAVAKGTFETMKQEATNTDNPESPIQQYTQAFLKSPVGWPFRQTFSRRLSAAVLGTPFGEPSLYVNAVSSLTRLAVQSLAEDSYGHVQRDVSTIIRTFTSVTKKLEAFKTEFPTHWTDVEGKKESPEVDAILETLKEGLSQLITSFGPYARDLRLSFADMRLAREAAGIKEVPRIEMRHNR